MRHTLVSAEKKEIPLFEEIDAVKNYLAIEKIRFEDKLEIEYDIDEKAKDFFRAVFADKSFGRKRNKAWIIDKSKAAQNKNFREIE